MLAFGSRITIVSCNTPELVLNRRIGDKTNDSEYIFWEDFELSSSPGLHGRGAGWDMIPPEVRQLWTEVLPPQA